jgi:hypothetical protein
VFCSVANLHCCRTCRTVHVSFCRGSYVEVEGPELSDVADESDVEYVPTADASPPCKLPPKKVNNDLTPREGRQMTDEVARAEQVARKWQQQAEAFSDQMGPLVQQDKPMKSIMASMRGKVWAKFIRCRPSSTWLVKSQRTPSAVLRGCRQGDVCVQASDFDSRLAHNPLRQVTIPKYGR